MDDLASVLAVALGGFAGATARYVVGVAVAGGLQATLTVNVLGCLAIGVVSGLDRERLPGATRTLLVTGFVASFTTYSTFALDAATLPPLDGAGYVVASYAGGFGAVLAGRAIGGRALFRHASGAGE